MTLQNMPQLNGKGEQILPFVISSDFVSKQMADFGTMMDPTSSLEHPY